MTEPETGSAAAPPVRLGPHPGTVIRPYAPADRQAVRDICCRTAFRNLGSDRLFEDREVHADFWTSYYTDHRAHEVSVIDRQGQVIGYFFGCSDHAHYLRVMGRRILPSCLARALWRRATGQYRNPATRAYLRHMLVHGAREAPPIDTRRYPAHYHCNMLRQGYGQGLYTQLTLAFLDRLEAQGIAALHGQITEPTEGGLWQKLDTLFTATRPDHRSDYRAEVATTLFLAVTGDSRPMVNRVWGVTVPHYRRWMEWVRQTYRL